MFCGGGKRGNWPILLFLRSIKKFNWIWTAYSNIIVFLIQNDKVPAMSPPMLCWCGCWCGWDWWWCGTCGEVWRLLWEGWREFACWETDGLVVVPSAWWSGCCGCCCVCGCCKWQLLYQSRPLRFKWCCCCWCWLSCCCCCCCCCCVWWLFGMTEWSKLLLLLLINELVVVVMLDVEQPTVLTAMVVLLCWWADPLELFGEISEGVAVLATELLPSSSDSSLVNSETETSLPWT